MAALMAMPAPGQEQYPAPVTASSGEAIAQTESGKVQGYIDGDVYVFKGIPYAKAERFMAPEKPDKWEGVRLTRVFGPACPQNSNLVYRGYNEMAQAYDYAFKYTKEVFDEKDLFTVNVFTKGLADGAKRPVFVWFHGGGFSSGSAINLPCYEGTSLAHKGDIVVVTVNHRLNVLGFLDLSSFGEKYKYSANTGVMDMVAALQWIHDNIESFGGDPSQVTVAGQSGGGGKVQTLMVTPSAKGLFQRAIVQSGPYGRGHMNSKSDARAFGAAVAKELGLSASDIDKIADVPYERLIEAVNSVRKDRGLKIGDGPTCGADDPTLPYDFFDPAAKELFAGIPLLIGSTFNEMDKTYYDKEYSDKEALDILKEKYGEKAEAFAKAFHEAYPERNNSDMLSVNTGTRNGTIIVADKKSSMGTAPVYNYLFAWKSPVLNYRFACCHNMDLPFMFDNIALQRELTGSTPDAYILADKMSGAWIAFTKTGNPSTEDLPQWPSYSPSDRYTMIFDKNCVVKHNHDEKFITLIDNQGI